MQRPFPGLSELMLSKLFRRNAHAPPVDRSTWESCLAQMPFLEELDGQTLERLIHLAEDFVRRKSFSGAQGFAVTDRVKASIALQACLPVLAIGLNAYDDFVEIIVYPDRFLTPRTQIDEAGVVHESVEALSGEAMQGGPVVLAWPDADPAMGAPGLSVVIHEFVHKLDMLDGLADGVPPMPMSKRALWQTALHAAYDQFCLMLEAVEAEIPPDVDPESEAADPYYARLPLDAYAATDEAEFFAVSAEAFFTLPGAISQTFPDLARVFSDYCGYRRAGDQDRSPLAVPRVPR